MLFFSFCYWHADMRYNARTHARTNVWKGNAYKHSHSIAENSQAAADLARARLFGFQLPFVFFPSSLSLSSCARIGQRPFCLSRAFLCLVFF